MATTRRIRAAGPADIEAITRVYRSDLPQGTWWRFPAGIRTPAHVEELTPFEQWLNGGPWMNPGYLTTHLRRLIGEGHLALVAEESTSGTGPGAGWAIRGEIEAFFYREAAEGGRAAHIGVLQVERGFFRHGFGRALVRRARREAARRGCYRVTVVSGRENLAFYRRCGFQPLTAVVTVEGRLPSGESRPELVPPPEDLVAGGTWPIVAGIHPGPGQYWYLYRRHAYDDPDFLAYRLDVTRLTLPADRGRRLRQAVASFRQNQLDHDEVIFYCLAEKGPGGDPSFGGVGNAGFAELLRWSSDLGYRRYRTYLTGEDFSKLRFFFRMREVGREYVLQARTDQLDLEGEDDELIP